MAIRLFAHILRGTHHDDETEDADGGRSLDIRRWMFSDLVVRRGAFAPWGLAGSVRTGAPEAPPFEAPPEPLWADTQPAFHR
jgi:hypothetical protein